MLPPLLLAVYCLLIVAASVAGGWVPQLVRLTHTRLQTATSFVAGLMLGVGILHLLPHAWHELKSIDRAAGWMLGGFLSMFLIQRFFRFHHHDVPDEAAEDGRPHESGHAEDCGHKHPEHTLAAKSARHLSWGGAAFGLTLHSLIDGFAVAASVAAEAGPGHGVGLLGLGTFLVVILHKPFDSMAITTLMAASGYSRFSRHLINLLFALVLPLGVLLFHFGVSHFDERAHVLLGSALAFSAGTFLCIASSDLLPELQFHAHDRGKLTAALAAGVVLAALIGFFESTGHDSMHPAQEVESAPHSEHGHEHNHR